MSTQVEKVVLPMIVKEIDFDIVCRIAREAGESIMKVYSGPFNVELKGDDSPLTSADRASHEVIVKGLQANFPDIPILSEEGRDIPYNERKEWPRFWLVDPLDGTKEFIKRNGEFTVNIALIEHAVVVAGVVYVPAQETMYYGGANLGCWKLTGSEAAEPVRVRQADHAKGLTVVMSRSHPSPELAAYLQDYQVADALPVGSSLKLCVVAEGKADLYPRLGPTMEWDTAAGHAVVEGAGGTVAT
ncbi:MAG: 3'(2'),5'-bisphosphate nucleotidase CysQ, partial [Desulfuromonadales bacterium]